MVQNLADSRSPLDAERRLVVAFLESLAGIRKEKHTVTFYKIIKIHRTILGRIPVRHHNQLNIIIIQLRYDEPSGRKEEAGTEDFA